MFFVKLHMDGDPMPKKKCQFLPSADEPASLLPQILLREMPPQPLPELLLPPLPCLISWPSCSICHHRLWVFATSSLLPLPLYSPLDPAVMVGIPGDKAGSRQ